MAPEKAIEMAAGFQMVGGAVGALGDPFKLLHMAQTDVAGLQDELIKASESAVTFNEETGEFDIPVTEMYRLKEMAQMTGKSYEQMADEAIKAKQRTEKLKLLENAVGGYTEEQKELIANLSEFGENGELKIKLPGMDEMVDASSLTKEQLDQLDELQKDQAKSAEEVSREIRDINKEQLSVLQVMKGGKAEIGAISLLKAEDTQAYGDIADVFGEVALTQSERVRSSVESKEMETQGTLMTQMIEEGFSNPTTIKAYAAGQLSLINHVFGNVPEFFDQVNLGLDEENIFKDAELLDKFGETLKKFGIDVGSIDVNAVNTVTDGLLSSFNKLYLEQNTEQNTGQNTGRSENNDISNLDDSVAPINRPEDGGVVEVTPVLNTDTNIDYANAQETSSPIEMIREGEVKVNGNINLTLNGMDLQKIDVVQLMNNPEFKSQVLKIVSGTETTYA